MEINELLISNFRIDGRKTNEIRIPEIEIDCIKNTSGSCLYTIGETKVLCWIVGPKEARGGKVLDNEGYIKCEFSIAPFANANRKSEFKRNLQMREFTTTLKEIFENIVVLKQYVKSEIEINVVVLQNDGSYKSASISAVTIALINAGIQIRDTAVGVSVGLIESNKNNEDGEINNIEGDVNIGNNINLEKVYFADLIKEEEKSKCPLLNACYLPNMMKFIYLEITNSTIDYSKSEKLIEFSEKVGQKSYKYITDYIKNYYLSR